VSRWTASGTKCSTLAARNLLEETQGVSALTSILELIARGTYTMSVKTEKTMIRKNWLNVVVFLPVDRWEQVLIRLYQEFKANEFMHHEVRNKHKNGIAVDIRLFCGSEGSSEIESAISRFMAAENISSKGFMFDPKKKGDPLFGRKAYCGFIDADIEIHEAWSEARVRIYHQLSVCSVGVLKELLTFTDPDTRAHARIESGHLACWMVGTVECVAYDATKKECVFGYMDRTTNLALQYGSARCA